MSMEKDIVLSQMDECIMENKWTAKDRAEECLLDLMDASMRGSGYKGNNMDKGFIGKLMGLER